MSKWQHESWHVVVPQTVNDGPYGRLAGCIDCQRIVGLQELPPASDGPIWAAVTGREQP